MALRWPVTIAPKMLPHGPRAHQRRRCITDQRVFYSTRQRSLPSTGQAEPATIEALAFAEDGTLEPLPSVELEAGWAGSIYARDARAFVMSGQLDVVDTRDPEAPVLTSHDFMGWSCSSLEVHEDTAYCALGQYGVFSVGLE